MIPYFNEIDEIACAVLNECYSGHVDGRSIKEVEPDDVREFVRCHWFAGAGLWEVACQLADWPATRPLWTASCPCQPFSQAGKGAAFDDPRDLWPDLFRLVRACRPPTVVGEITSGRAGYHWFDRTCSDLEGEGYACRAVDIPACSVDAPHQRNRLYWVAVGHACREGREISFAQKAERPSPKPVERSNDQSPMADANGSGRRWRAEDAQRDSFGRDAAERADDGSMEYTEDWAGRDAGEFLATQQYSGQYQSKGSLRDSASGSNSGSFWSDHVWLQCADGKARRSKPDLRLLVDGMAGRADLWRLAGNSIVPQLAAEVLRAIG